MFLTAAKPGTTEADEERDSMLDHIIGPAIEGDVRNGIVRQACRVTMDNPYSRNGRHPMVAVAEEALRLSVDECLIMLESEDGNDRAIEILKAHFFI